MNNRKYIGMDVHQASISIAVSDASGKVLTEPRPRVGSMIRQHDQVVMPGPRQYASVVRRT